LPCWPARSSASTRPHFAAQLHFLGDIFLRLIRMIVAPLIFGGIVTGIAGHSELAALAASPSNPRLL
jgi:Na+/H+-dicarboxylate symporter